MGAALKYGGGVGAVGASAWAGYGAIKSFAESVAITDRGTICGSYAPVEVVCNQQHAIESIMGSSAVADTLGNPVVLGDVRLVAMGVLGAAAVSLFKGGRRDAQRGNHV